MADFGIALAHARLRCGDKTSGSPRSAWPRHAELHEPRAGHRRRPARRPERRLLPRLRPVRDARRRPAVPRPDRAGHHRPAVHRDGCRRRRRTGRTSRRCWTAIVPAGARAHRPTGSPPPAPWRAALREAEPWDRPRPALDCRGGGEASIAVLPFANLSPSPENEFFADGMTDELINALPRCRGCTSCRGPRASLQGKGGGRPGDRPPAPGAHRARGERAPGGPGSGCRPSHHRRRRLPALVRELRPRGGGHLRDPGRDRPADRQRLRLRCSTRSASPRPCLPTEDLEAYGLYLKGRPFWNRRTDQDLRLGMRYFDRRWSGIRVSRSRTPGWRTPGPCSASTRRCRRTRRSPTPTVGARALGRQPGLAEAYPAWPTRRSTTTGTGRGGAGVPPGDRAAPGLLQRAPVVRQLLSIMGGPKSPSRSSSALWRWTRCLHFSTRRLAGVSLRAAVRARSGGVPRGIELEPSNVVAHAWLAMGLEAISRTDEAVLRAEETATLASRGMSSLGFLWATPTRWLAGWTMRAGCWGR